MKKRLMFVFCFLVCISLCACGGDGAKNCNHNYKITETVHSTCNSVGYLQYVCENCNHSYRLEQPMAEHAYADATCSKPQTCSVCGATTGELAPHSYADATCGKPMTCSICGATTGEAKEHNYTDATCTTPKTCSICGTVAGEALGHRYSDVTCAKPKTCAVCGDVSGSATSHQDNGSGRCKYCDADMLLSALEKSVKATLIVPSSGVNNCYFSMKFVNNSEYTISFTDIGTGNGQLCWNKSNDGKQLAPGKTLTVSYYRSYSGDRFNDRYYDMYLDANSFAYIPVNVNNRRVYIKANVKGEMMVGYTRGEIGEVD